jgi:hypothetical protein
LSASEALEWGAPAYFFFFREKLQYLLLATGLVNYVSSPGATAFDRALTLAEAISKNGTICTLSTAALWLIFLI